MPYRRLPNTDAARISSLKKALSKSQMPFSENPVIPFKLVHEIETLLPKFETAVDRFKSTYNEQAKANKKHQVHLKNARHLMHLIQKPLRHLSQYQIRLLNLPRKLLQGS